MLQEGAKAEDQAALRETLQAHVKDRIGVWKYPRWVEFVEGLPKTATGKIQRYKLKGRGVMQDGRASTFETRPLGAPQDEDGLMAYTNLPHPEEQAQTASRRTHGA